MYYINSRLTYLLTFIIWYSYRIVELMVCRAQVELKQTAEKLHVQDITSTMSHTEAFKLMMREKESLIAEKYQLSEKYNTLRRQTKAADEKWQREKEGLEQTVADKSSALDETKQVNDRLKGEIAQLKVYSHQSTVGRGSIFLKPAQLNPLRH